MRLLELRVLWQTQHRCSEAERENGRAVLADPAPGPPTVVAPPTTLRAMDVAWLPALTAPAAAASQQVTDAAGQERKCQRCSALRCGM